MHCFVFFYVGSAEAGKLERWNRAIEEIKLTQHEFLNGAGFTIEAGMSALSQDEDRESGKLF